MTHGREAGERANREIQCVSEAQRLALVTITSLLKMSSSTRHTQQQSAAIDRSLLRRPNAVSKRKKEQNLLSSDDGEEGGDNGAGKDRERKSKGGPNKRVKVAKAG